MWTTSGIPGVAGCASVPWGAGSSGTIPCPKAAEGAASCRCIRSVTARSTSISTMPIWPATAVAPRGSGSIPKSRNSLPGLPESRRIFTHRHVSAGKPGTPASDRNGRTGNPRLTPARPGPSRRRPAISLCAVAINSDAGSRFPYLLNSCTRATRHPSGRNLLQT